METRHNFCLGVKIAAQCGYIYDYSPQEQTRTTEKIDKARKNRKNYKLDVQYKH